MAEHYVALPDGLDASATTENPRLGVFSGHAVEAWLGCLARLYVLRSIVQWLINQRSCILFRYLPPTSEMCT